MAKQITVAVLCGLATVLSLIVAPSPARSCSCVPSSPRRYTIPSHGAENFPVDGKIRVFLEGGFPEALKRAVSREYRLRGPDGELVPLTTRLVGNRLDFLPEKDLQNNSEYTLERVAAYSGSGRLLGDLTRWRHAEKRAGLKRPRAFFHTSNSYQPPLPIRRAWMPVSSFQTGHSDATRDLSRPAIEASKITVPRDPRCRDPMFSVVKFDLPEHIRTTDFVGLEIEGHDLVTLKRAHFETDEGVFLLANGACTRSPVTLRFDQSYRVRLVIFDESGRRLTGSSWASTEKPPSEIDEKSLLYSGSDREASTIRDAVAQWSNPELLEDVSPPDRPPVCRYGFRSSGPERISESKGSHALAEIPPPSLRSVEGWMELQSTYLEGEPQWRHSPVGRDAEQGREMAVGGGRAMVVYASEDGDGDARLAWRLFDTSSGELLSQHVDSLAVEDGVAVAPLDEGFMVASIPANSDSESIVISIVRDGIEQSRRRLERETEGAVALASNGKIAGLATQSEGSIYLGFLDAKGRAFGKPFNVSLGSSYHSHENPEIVWVESETSGSTTDALESIVGLGLESPRAGWLNASSGFWAVAWQSGRRSYAVAAAPGERVSRTFALNGGADSSLIDLLATDGKVLASYDDLRLLVHVYFAEILECRDTRASGPPQRIEVGR